MKKRIVLLLALMIATGTARADDVFEGVTATPQLVAPGVISTGDDESHPMLSPDGHTLYFLKNTPSFDFWTIVVSRVKGHAFGKPETAPFSGRYADGDPAFSPDGKYLYFVSSRPVNGVPRQDTEIWRIAVRKKGWGEPEHVEPLSSPGNEFFPTFAADGTIYFGSDRAGGLGGYDIWAAHYRNGAFDKPRDLGAPVNSPENEIEAFVTPDGHHLVMAAKGRADSLGAYDLYIANRCADGRWSPPANAGAPVNSAGWDFGAKITPDGRYLLFTSSRGFGSEPLQRALSYDELVTRIRQPHNGLRDIYVMRADALFNRPRSCR